VESIYKFVAKQRDSYRSDTIEITEGYDFSQYETLRTIELYDNDRFLSGNKDSLDREKPFFNIVSFRKNVATRATDLDTKDVQIQSDRITKTSYAETFLLNLKSRNWMKLAGFATFLNRMGATRCKYGGVLVKKTEGNGELGIHVVAWLNAITDQVDIRNGVKIERHYYTPAQLKTEVPKNWQNIDDAIETAKKARTSQAAISAPNQNKTPGNTIEVWEVHGVLPTRFLAGTNEAYPESSGSDTEYERQMHVVVLDGTDKDKVEGVTLYAGIEDEDPYKYLPYEEVDGRGLGKGVIESLFEAQVWTNYSEKQKKDMLDLAAKIIFQTTDQNIAAQNVLTDLENGQIVTLTADKTLNRVDNSASSFAQFQALAADWDKQAERVSSTFNAITGETMPSGTPYRQTAILNQEAGSLFEYRREEAGIFVREIFMDWVLPFLVKQIKKDKDLTATLEPEELELVSEAVANHEADKFAKDRILKGESITPEEKQAVHSAVREASMQLRRRSFKGFDKLFTDWMGTVDVITTGEQKNKAAMLETISNIIKFVTSMQLPDGRNLALEDGPMRNLFLQLMELAGVSPLLLTKMQTQPQAPAPVQQPRQTTPPAAPADATIAA
jgi:hypothetical protein